MTRARWGRRVRAGTAAVALFIALGQTAHAQGLGLPGQDRGKPIEINAEDGIEWRQRDKVYVARGKARAAQGEVTVYADVLTAHYRELKGGSTEIWRIDADGNVRIASPRQTAHGDKAVYDVDKGVLVLTGNVRLVTETDRISARDSLEYWEKRNLAVARGKAVAVRGDRRLMADILAAHFKKDDGGANKVHEIEAFDNVLISSPEEIVRADYGVYNVETGIANLTGSVKITRGDSQLNGARARVNLNTGVSTLLGGAEGVRGYLTPDQARKRLPRTDR
jgi:lipopolysaccharide export system protein LptA